MQEMRSRYVLSGARVLDVGGADVNGSYRRLFSDCSYVTLDLHPSADIVVEGYDWPLDDASFDIVVSGQTLEHDKFFWLTVRNIARVVVDDGVFLLVVPAAWPIHRFPIDCYRFLPDSIYAMAEWGGFNVLSVKHDQSSLGPGRADLAAALRKQIRR